MTDKMSDTDADNLRGLLLATMGYHDRPARCATCHHFYSSMPMNDAACHLNPAIDLTVNAGSCCDHHQPRPQTQESQSA